MTFLFEFLDALPAEARGAVYTVGAAGVVAAPFLIRRWVRNLLVPKALEHLTGRDMLRRATLRTWAGSAIAAPAAGQLMGSMWWAPLIFGGTLFVSGVIGCIKRGS